MIPPCPSQALLSYWSLICKHAYCDALDTIPTPFLRYPHLGIPPVCGLAWPSVLSDYGPRAVQARPPGQHCLDSTLGRFPVHLSFAKHGTMPLAPLLATLDIGELERSSRTPASGCNVVVGRPNFLVSFPGLVHAKIYNARVHNLRPKVFSAIVCHSRFQAGVILHASRNKRIT